MNINEIIEYIKKYEGMKYTKYDKNSNVMTPMEPFWVSNKGPPPFQEVYNKGSTCVGLINIVRRHIGLTVPGLNENYECPGGTESWYKYLYTNNRLEPLDLTKSYPLGTLLVQDFNEFDQGHVAVIISDNTKSDTKNVMESTIIHNICGTWDNKTYASTVIEKLGEYPYYSRFTHVCYPENWLLKN